MENNTILNKFKGECQVINFKYEYPGYTGEVKFGIVTDLSEKELIDKYGEILGDYSPYILLDRSYAKIRKKFKKNERKHQWRIENTYDCFGYEDGEVENYHSELIGESGEDQYLQQLANSVLYAALNRLTEVQKRRLTKYYFEGLTLEKIAEEESVHHTAVLKSIRSSLKKLKIILEKGSQNDLSHWE